MALDVPHIGTSNYTSAAYTLANMNLIGNGAGGWLGGNQTGIVTPPQQLYHYVPPQTSLTQTALVADMPEKTVSRFVRVIIVDPNDNLSLEDRLVFKGDEKFTDLNDQELFFELDIKALLATHNEKRLKTVDKAVKERTEYLEPAKIRDLKMVVVNIATF